MKISLKIICISIFCFILCGCQEAPTLGEFVLTHKINAESGEALGNSLQFLSETEAIYAVSSLGGGKQESKIRARFFLSGASEPQMIMEKQVQAKEPGYVSFKLAAPKGGFPAGEYAVSLYLNDEEIGTKRFSVRK